jgi:hypothetical protein
MFTGALPAWAAARTCWGCAPVENHADDSVASPMGVRRRALCQHGRTAAVSAVRGLSSMTLRASRASVRASGTNTPLATCKTPPPGLGALSRSPQSPRRSGLELRDDGIQKPTAGQAGGRAVEHAAAGYSGGRPGLTRNDTVRTTCRGRRREAARRMSNTSTPAVSCVNTKSTVPERNIDAERRLGRSAPDRANARANRAQEVHHPDAASSTLSHCSLAFHRCSRIPRLPAHAVGLTQYAGARQLVGGRIVRSAD